MAVRILELFCGIGGCAAALEGVGEVCAAVDHHQAALATYALNFTHPIWVMNLNHIQPSRLGDYAADLWWMSPPCQPHTIRGHQRDLDDRRSQSFKAVVRAIGTHPPPSLALENVPWFRDSRAHALLRTTLEALGYEVMEWMLCPTQLGIPNERKRFYLVASRTPLIQPPPLEAQSRPLASYLSADPKPHLTVEPALRQRFGDAFHCVDPADESAIAACFTSAYGRSPVYAGSYIRQGDHIRHFSPEEIAALLHLPLPFHFPEDRSLRTRWSLVGNSLSVPVVRYVLSALPRLQHLGSLPRLTSHHPPTP